VHSLYLLDPEIAAALAPLAAKAADAPPIERGDWMALRERANANLALLSTLNPPVSDDVRTQPLWITVDDGIDIAARLYTRGNERPGSAVVYAHGGGMIAGDLDLYVLGGDQKSNRWLPEEPIIGWMRFNRNLGTLFTNDPCVEGCGGYMFTCALLQFPFSVRHQNG
jgi:hypothetical protein